MTETNIYNIGVEDKNFNLNIGQDSFDFNIVTGAPGPAGADGPQGPQGPQGEKGDTGDVGAKYNTVGCSFDGFGTTLKYGLSASIIIPYNATILNWYILADVSGSIAIDVWKDTLANYPPTVSNSIVGTGKPTITSSNKANGDVTDWSSTTITENDIIKFNIDSCSDITRAVIVLELEQSI